MFIPVLWLGLYVMRELQADGWMYLVVPFSIAYRFIVWL